MTKLAKIGLLGLFINYYPFHIMFGHLIPRGTYLFLGMTAVGILGGLDEHRKVYVKENTVQTWCVYWALSFLLSEFALSPEYAVKSLSSFAVKIFITFAVSYVCEKDGNVFFAFQLLATTAILSALAAFVQAGDISLRLDLVSGARVSINDFGSLMAYGCFAVIFIFYYRSYYKGVRNTFITRLFVVIASFLLVYELFISGSRKALFAVVLLYVLMLVLVWLRARGTFDLSNIITILILGLGMYMIYEIFLEDILQYTSLYRRVFGDKADAAAGSDIGRVNLYKLAFRHFIENPLIGMGFNNFKYKYGVYTHSTYADPIACSGLMGLLYLIPVFRILRKLFTLATKKMLDNTSRQLHTMMLIFYIEFLFIGIGIPYIYKEIPCIVYGMMIAWIKISFTELADGGAIK